MTTMLILAINNVPRARGFWVVRIRIVRKPVGVIEGMSLNRLRLGEVYDLTPTLANYLVVEGFAVFESRRTNKATPIERRKPKSNKIR